MLKTPFLWVFSALFCFTIIRISKSYGICYNIIIISDKRSDYVKQMYTTKKWFNNYNGGHVILTISKKFHTVEPDSMFKLQL